MLRIRATKLKKVTGQLNTYFEERVHGSFIIVMIVDVLLRKVLPR